MTTTRLLQTVTAVRDKLAVTLVREEGAGLAEYALLLLLIAIVCFGAVGDARDDDFRRLQHGCRDVQQLG